MLDYIVPIITAAIMAHNFTSSTPELTSVPDATYKDSYTVEVNGKENSRVFLNGIEVATLKSDGKVYIDLNTSGAYGTTKDFQISLKNKNNQETQALIFSIDKVQAQISRLKAIKLLRQASFTSHETQIEEVMIRGEDAWIDKQLATVGDLDVIDDKKFGYLESMTRFLHKSDPATYPESLFADPYSAFPETPDGLRLKVFNRSIWWQKALHNEDQLRQRVAYALSQILVVGQEGSGHLGFRGEAAAHYYDILVEHAFGNYGELLKDISMNATMADYLTFIASSKENNETGIAPDENYARELMQLFSVGLYELNDDGTRELGADKFPIPTYTQDDVSEMARVFTGWALSSNHYEITKNTKYDNIQNYMHSFILPIRSFNDGEFHDDGEKTVLGETIEAGLTPEGDIDRAIEILMANKNIGPHVCRELINRLVTSNPTPEYMSRVVAKFNNNGNGVKGDLKATIKAILIDDEARLASSSVYYGKVDEYMLLTTHYLSSLNVKPYPIIHYLDTEMEDTYWFTPETLYYHQVPLGASSVFNFYSPEYVPNDISFTKDGLVAPEFEQRTSDELMSFENFLSFILRQNKYEYKYIDTLDGSEFIDMLTWAQNHKVSHANFQGLYIDTTNFYEEFSMFVDGDKERRFDNLNDSATKTVSEHGKVAIGKLVDYLDNHFTGGTMPKDYKDELTAYLQTSNLHTNRIHFQAQNIVKSAIRAIIMSPSYMVLK